MFEVYYSFWEQKCSIKLDKIRINFLISFMKGHQIGSSITYNHGKIYFLLVLQGKRLIIRSTGQREQCLDGVNVKV